ncbi:MAG: PSD1 and planctomycete cytochrome C domain-containing protein [Planctomycetaceae bacterium]
MQIRVSTLMFLVILGIMTPVSGELPAPADKKIDYTKDVKPILKQNCLSCHGDLKHESGLRLDSREGLLRGGDLGKAVVLGKSAESRLIHYVAATDPKNVMPPEGDHLPAAAVGILRAWIDQGCVWPQEENGVVAKNTHWAYQPLRNGPPPTTKRVDWGLNPIDQFVLAKLEQRGIAPSLAADRYTLIRRLYLDLLGLLPPVPEVDAFVQDNRPTAYEELVDRLLDSPHFGERWGRHWLDMARYADSDGYEKDNPRPDAYRWRDWVINAINADVPFDQFTIEQLAGDLLPNATSDQRLATAFHRQTLTNTEGGTDQEQFRNEACFDRTETTGAVWLGLTVGCARCHSHKYDAITQREYYQFFAVFNNGDEQSIVIPKTPAEIAAYGPVKAAHDAQVAAALADLQAEQSRQTPAFVAWEEKVRKEQMVAAASPIKPYLLEELRVTSDSEATFQQQKDGSTLVGGGNPDRVIYTITGRLSASEINSLRLDVLPDPSLPANGPGRVAHGNFVLSEMTAEVSSSAEFTDARRLEFSGAKADFEQGDKPWAAKDVIDGNNETGWAIAPHFGKPHWAVFGLKEPFKSTAPVYVRVRLSQQYGTQHTIGRFKITLQSGIEPGTSLPENIAKIVVLSPDQRNETQRQQLLAYFSSLHSPTKELQAKLDDIKKKEPPKPEISVRVIGQRTQNPRKTFVLKRGEFLEPLKDLEVQPAAMETLPAFKARESSQMADRLDLARWLVSTDNPLPPRVTVNHVWRQLFGTGIVRTPNDFGVRGDPPTHPELLDWLAAEFIGLKPAGSVSAGTGKYAPGTPWSRKSLIKRIVMSATYRQSSQHREELRDVDPQNQWLARQNRLRVEGEIVRDISLEVAGLLSTKIGGPSVFPPLPPGIAELSYAGNFRWEPSKGEDRYRRGMYTFFKRTAPHPNLTMFDCPDANLTCVERRTSNTPLQALTSLNNETFSETSRAFARRLLTTAASDDRTRLSNAIRLSVARPPRDSELTALAELLKSAREWYRTHPDQARQLVGADAAPAVSADENAAWIATARILINLDEFITRE